MAKERIDKLLSHEGFGSRKDIKKLMRSAEVLVNGKRIFDSGFQLDAETDLITIDGEEINLHKNLYLMMNKIQNTVSSTKEGDHQTVFDLLDDSLRTPYLQDKLHLVGRLDLDTEGLLLFTTDGSLTHRVTSPKNHINKTYLCILEKPENEEHQKQIANEFEKGVHIAADDNDPETDCAPALVEWPESEKVLQWLEKSSAGNLGINNSETKAALLTIHEGRYHQVKRMFAAVNNKVIFLKRISMGNLILDQTLLPGEYRELSQAEVALLEE